MKNEAPFGYCDLCGKKALYRYEINNWDRATGKPLEYTHIVFCNNHKDRFGDRRERILDTAFSKNDTIPVKLFV